MAEANLPASGSSSGQFHMTLMTPEQFNQLNPFDQRKEYERIYILHKTCNEQRKSQSNDTKRGRLQEEDDLHDSSPVDQTLVGRQSANPSERSLVEALRKKDGRYDELEQKANSLSSDLQDREQQLQNATVRIDDMKSMLSASVENCSLIIQVSDDLRDKLDDRDMTIHTMAQSARREHERNAEISALMEVLQSGQEQLETENRTLRQQIQEEMWRSQILRNLLQMIGRHSLRQGRHPLLIIQPLFLPDTEVIPEEI